MTEVSDIVGVHIKSLKTHGDQRGFFREIIRFNEPIFEGAKFAQWSHSKMQKNVVKAWHYHHIQFDWWYIGEGLVETVLYDNRPESPTYQSKLVIQMGSGQNIEEGLAITVKIPPGVLHGLKVLSESAELFYITSEIYNPNEEGRFPYNAPEVPHEWGDDVIVVDNDKRYFTPTSIREKIA